MIARRVDQFADELMFDRDRLLGWGLSQAVLAAWWSYDDDDENWRSWLACAEVFASVE